MKNRIEAHDAAATFFLFHRNRRWNAKDELWMGWERKRGKLEEFNAALRGDFSAFALVAGPTDRLADTKYVITLDSDTELPRDVAHQLAGVMSHPLNRPFYDAKLGRITEGYGILQPRVGVGVPAANRSQYSRLFSGEPGIDPYTRAVSDVYQDVFDEGSFIGKGIYDVDAMTQAIAGRLPENRILSHDLLEGAYARAGLVSDIVLFEDFPSAYPVDVSRRYRWMRGDWQIVPWLLPRVPSAGGAVGAQSALAAVALENPGQSPPQPDAVALVGAVAVGMVYSGRGGVLHAGRLRDPASAGDSDASGGVDPPPEGSFLHPSLGAGDRRIVAAGFAGGVYARLPSLRRLDQPRGDRPHGRARAADPKKAAGMANGARRATQQRAVHIAGFYATMWILPLAAAGVGLARAVSHPRVLEVAGQILGLWLITPGIAALLSEPIRRTCRNCGKKISRSWK